MKNRFALLFAVLGFATLIGALVFSRDNHLGYQKHQQAPASAEVSAMPANAASLSPTIETLSEVPAAPTADAAPAEAAKPEASDAKAPQVPKAPKAKA
ncbi:MAG: hypothetical protein JST24_02605 [Acidobacteria bacterium]|nr:hypothetical protein [Acidobacteriota bacterium]